MNPLPRRNSYLTSADLQCQLSYGCRQESILDLTVCWRDKARHRNDPTGMVESVLRMDVAIR
jgi:hypothetical protein